MAKIMLVEDDNNLREIYQARLSAEGYEIVTAKDGEEALAVAVKEKPDLIISDVMMPKVSGFEMLDILRSTAGIKDTKVIMMTALSQADDKARAEKLGADRYLVKSQVTLEDMAKTVQDVLNGVGPGGTGPSDPVSSPPAAPASDSSSPASGANDSATAAITTNTREQLLSTAADQLKQAAIPAPVLPGDKPMEIIQHTTPAPNPSAVATEEVDNDAVEISRKKIIQPLNDLTKPDFNLNELLAIEEAKEKVAGNSEAGSVISSEPQPTQETEQPVQKAGFGSTTITEQPPGQVISPQIINGHEADPNSIAL